MTENKRMELWEAKNSFTGKILTVGQFDES